MQDRFNELAAHIESCLEGSEVFTATYEAESSDFVRFNHGKVRQAGNVLQQQLGLDLIDGARHVGASITLSGDAELDRPRLSRLVSRLREQLASVPEDPHLLYATEPTSTERVDESTLPEAGDAIGRIQQAADGRDLVGIYAAGAVHSGFANSLGQRNWYSTHSYNLDWSFYLRADKAVKTSYAGFAWDPVAFQRKVDLAGKQLDALGAKPRKVEPGRYRVYMAPAAVYDMVGMLAWGGFGLKALRTRRTPLLLLAEGARSMDPGVSIRENTADGIAPNFQEAGFLRPDAVPLIDRGAHADCLVSPRSAKEFGVPTNGASAGESPESLEMDAGALDPAGVIGSLDRGIYIGNVWYLNFSDRMACRTTGMTRFATFWVEGGEVVAPIDVMRFDETLYRMLGENLVGLTSDRDWILDADTYFKRTTTSGRMPGALVEDFAFTL